MKCSWDAERSFSSEARHFVMNSCGVTTESSSSRPSPSPATHAYFGGSGTPISAEVEHRFRRKWNIDFGKWNTDFGMWNIHSRGKWNAGSGVVNARR